MAEPLIGDDGLLIREVGIWAEEKYQLLGYYASLFAGSMVGKWGTLVYLDPFAGPGRVRIKESGHHTDASPLVVLGLEKTFDRFIFGDADEDAIDALDQRVRRRYPNTVYSSVPADVNREPEKLLAEIPPHGKGRTVLTLCFLDPYRLRHLHFETIARLGEKYMDFLVLIPSGMDANRNEGLYTGDDDHTLDRFLGNSDWRQRWKSVKETTPRPSFERFVVEEFGRSMTTLGFQDPGIENTAVAKNERKVTLYRLSLYSRSALGLKFWKESRHYSDPQTSFGF